VRSVSSNPPASSKVEKRISTSLDTDGSGANPVRGEALVRVAGLALVLRPSFAALVAAEEELGPLFRLVERAAAGELRLAELVALFWHCLRDRPEGLTRDAFAEGLAAAGLAAATPALRVLLRQVLQGR
jgi:hypothetical protein